MQSDRTTSPAMLAGAEPEADADWLRALLERQPSCLMRVGIDGTLLAVSDAALNLLGATALSQVLETSLIERLHGDAEEIWTDFVSRVLQAGSASVECEMHDLAGVGRAVLLQGVSLPSHPDGAASLLLTSRDVSTARRLQASLQEQEDLRRSAQDDCRQAAEHVRALQARLEEITAERQQLRAALDLSLVEREELGSALNDLRTALGTAIDSTLLAQQVVEKGRHR